MCIPLQNYVHVNHSEIITSAAFSIIQNPSKELLIQSANGESGTINVNALLFHSPLLKDIFDSEKNNEDLGCITFADIELEFHELKVIVEFLSMSWNTRKEIFLKNSILNVLKVLKVNIPKVYDVETVNEFIIFCPNQPCQYQSQGSRNSRKNNLIEHLLKSHNLLQHRIAVEKCFPPHSKPKGFVCRECQEIFQGKNPDVREAHVRSKHKYLFDMKSVNKAADGALKIMKEVKKDLVSKIRPMSENLINTEVSKQQRLSKDEEKEYKKQEVSIIEKADFNGNSHSSTSLEELLNSNDLCFEDISNLNDSADDLLESNVFAESNVINKPNHNTSATNNLLRNVSRMDENEMMNNSSDDILESSVIAETNDLGLQKEKLRKGSKRRKIKRRSKKLISSLHDSQDFI